MTIFLRIFVLFASAFLISCIAPKATNQVEKAKKKPVNPPQLVGRIASIPPERRFVLIQSYGKWTVPANSILITRGDEERSANLLATGEHLGQYAAADIRSGDVQVGDGVYYREIKESGESTETSAPLTPLASPDSHDPPKNGQEPNVQKNN
ncbi:MAG: hypothetical protein QM627_13590 [Luteolibacter sp.]